MLDGHRFCITPLILGLNIFVSEQTTIKKGLWSCYQQYFVNYHSEFSISSLTVQMYNLMQMEDIPVRWLNILLSNLHI